MFTRAASALTGSRFLELRLDALPKPAETLGLFRTFHAAHGEATLLATCRRTAGGGGYGGTPAEQLDLLLRFAQAGAALVDVELETLEAASAQELLTLAQGLARCGSAALVSAHDFQKTGDLRATLRKLQALGRPLAPVLYKVVSTATRLTDNLAMLALIRSAAADAPVVGICMGSAGLPSRVLALQAGAPFTFAAPEEGAASAPGQVSARLLLEEYRASKLTAATQLFGVAGNPIGQSLSPCMHNAAFRHAGLDAVYLPLHTESAEDLLHLARELPLQGISVTMPWKVEVLPLLEEVAPQAAQIGAVNTIARRAEGGFRGSNTDAAAILDPLRQRMELSGARILLLGAGGAARAAAFALTGAGARVEILNRTVAAAEQLARESGASVAERASLRGFDAVIQATPAGMQGQPAAPIDADTLRGAKVAFEMVYRPRQTAFTQLAESLGIEVITGVEMFVHQGAQQWSAWTGKAAPEATMREAVEASLRGQDALG